MKAAQEIVPELQTLAAQLASEPFCREHALTALPLSKVNSFIETHTENALEESFRQFKAVYCLFLMKLEMLGGDDSEFNTKTLSDFLPAGRMLHVVPNQSAAPSFPSDGPGVQAAAEYYSTALYFRSLRESQTQGDLPEAHLRRLEALHLCFALEVEFQEKLAAPALQLWPVRREKTASLWDPHSPKGDFHPALLQYWKTLVASCTFWPANERFPLLTFKNTLRFLASSPDELPPKPSLLESGLWWFVFGQDLDLGGLQLTNPMGTPRLPQAGIADTFLRLCRIHRLKTLLLNPSFTLSDDELEELKTHTKMLSAFSNARGSGFPS